MIINADKLFTFKQRAQELMKALKRHYTQARQCELDSIERQLRDIGQNLPKGKTLKD